MLKYKNTTDILIMAMTIAMVVLSVYAMYHTGYRSGFNSAKSLVENSSLGAMLRTPDDIRILPGTVTAVGADRITIHSVSNNPFDPLSDRTVLITTSTKITKFTQKDPAMFKAEMDVYTKAAKSKTPPTPPEFFTIAAIAATDIKVGDTVMVTATDNIKSLQTFTAAFIQIQVLPVPPANPSARPVAQ